MQDAHAHSDGSIAGPNEWLFREFNLQQNISAQWLEFDNDVLELSVEEFPVPTYADPTDILYIQPAVLSKPVFAIY